jgi:hypothetical protein
MNSLRTRLRDERGAELIEFALVLPLLLLVVLGMVDFGFLFQRMEVATNAAREGARIAVLPGYVQTDVCLRALTYLQNGGVTTTGTCPNPTNPVININMAYSIPMGAGNPALTGKRVEVVYTSSYAFLGPIMQLFGGNMTSVPVRGVAIMRDEVPAP